MLRDKETSKQMEYEIVLLDELVPQDHMLRKIDAAVDFSFIHDLCKECSNTSKRNGMKAACSE